jgi:hypothetical protein
MRTTFLIIFFLITSITTFAQFKISGKVVNATNKVPLDGATVFINNTKFGTKTDNKGFFTIYNLQPGRYELIVSMIGFRTQKTQVFMQGDTKVPSIAIEERSFALNEVKINAVKKIKNRYMDMFKREILGSSKFAKQCVIINPKVIQLHFDKTENNLNAYTSDFMVVENKALGYRLKYQIEDFERNEKNALVSYIGYVLFEEMEGNEAQHQKWQANRLEAYTGSLQHFFRSALGNQINSLREPGFIVRTMTRAANPYRLPDSLIKAKMKYYSIERTKTPKDTIAFWLSMGKIPRYIEVIDTTRLQATDILKVTDQKGLFTLKIDTVNHIKQWGMVQVPGIKGGSPKLRCDTCNYINLLYVTYNDKPPAVKLIKRKGQRTSSFMPTPDMEAKSSLIIITGENVFFDWNGVVENPLSLKLEKYWANQRLGDLLPIDYLPNIGTINANNSQ